MLEGKELILATQPFAKEDRSKSWMHLLTTLLVLGLAYCGIFYKTPIFIKIVCSIITGLTLVRLFVIYHDFLHKAILQKSWLATIIFTLFGLYILAPRSIWKRSHDYHHKHNSKLHTSSVGSFPIVTKDKFLASEKKERRLYLFIRNPFIILLGYIFAFTYGMCIKSFISSQSKHWDSILSLLLHFSAGTLLIIFFPFQIFVFAFLVPSFISGALGTYLFYAQHNFPTATFEEKDGWTYSNAALKSSSYMKMNFLMRWFTANIGYHHIHHINARIPFYRLPEVFRKMKEFQHPKVTTLKPTDILKCVRLKVWDPDKQKMIGLKEIYA